MIKAYEVITRAKHPEWTFQTRALACPDGITRIVTYPTELWDTFDLLCINYKGFREKAFTRAIKSLPAPDEAKYSFNDTLYYQIMVQLRLWEAMEETPHIHYKLLFNKHALQL